MSLSWIRAAAAGIVAGVVATVVQIILWWAFTDNLPWITVPRCAFNCGHRYGAAVLPPPSTFDLTVMIVATGIHTGLSVAYSLILVFAIRRRPIRGALLAGLVFGLILYVVNMYGMTGMFPWFSEVRDWITVAAHVVFGISVAAVYKILPENQSA